MDIHRFGQQGFASLADPVGEAHNTGAGKDAQSVNIVVPAGDQAGQNPFHASAGLIAEHGVPSGEGKTGPERTIGENNNLRTPRAHLCVGKGLGEPRGAHLALATIEFLHLNEGARTVDCNAVRILITLGDQLDERQMPGA